MVNNLPEDIREDIARWIAEMIRRKNRYFADNRRAIVNVRVTDTGDGFPIAVASLMPGDRS